MKMCPLPSCFAGEAMSLVGEDAGRYRMSSSRIVMSEKATISTSNRRSVWPVAISVTVHSLLSGGGAPSGLIVVEAHHQ